MFGLNDSMHYYLCTRCVDMRNGINGLSKIVRDEMGLAPLGGGIFVFLEMPWRTFSLIMQGISTKSVRYRKRMRIDV